MDDESSDEHPIENGLGLSSEVLSERQTPHLP
jgi:hypothetical protein